MSMRGRDDPPENPMDPTKFIVEPAGPAGPPGADRLRKADLDHLKRLREAGSNGCSGPAWSGSSSSS